MLSQEEYDNRMREIQKAKNKKTLTIILTALGMVVIILIISPIIKNREVENKVSSDDY